MRRAIATCLVLIFAFLVSADGSSCPDGCADANSQLSYQDVCDDGGSCLLCLSSLNVGLQPDTAAHVPFDAPDFLPTTVQPDRVLTRQIDHPPRA